MITTYLENIYGEYIIIIHRLTEEWEDIQIWNSDEYVTLWLKAVVYSRQSFPTRGSESKYYHGKDVSESIYYHGKGVSVSVVTIWYSLSK